MEDEKTHHLGWQLIKDGCYLYMLGVLYISVKCWKKL